MQETTNSREASQEEQRFRDLFGKEELENARELYFACGQRTLKMTYPEYLRKQTERKLREQDGD